ncbi:hypothetical protein [Planctobacterium marinum]|uniref:Class IIb bacteriocin, lactobin A/cerein 7B family n=1 Tax=Planctobacterium marinum TaxID=1631968 RepID=A0AA48HSP6_9ALTE|nr:hypothetical protein MACH26_35280 [Planctobacterium marinum]
MELCQWLAQFKQTAQRSDVGKEMDMNELSIQEIEQVNGGVTPVLIAIGKGIGWGITTGSAIFGVGLAASAANREP